MFSFPFRFFVSFLYVFRVHKSESKKNVKHFKTKKFIKIQKKKKKKKEDQCLSPLVEENVIPSPEPSDGVQVAHLPHLWTHASNNERQEVELGLLSPQEMERLHSIRPTGVNNANRNPWMFDPLKVCYKSLISVYVSG